MRACNGEACLLAPSPAPLLFLALHIPQTAHAHVGSKDVFEQVEAGPYKLYITIRMPTVIPGVATVEVRIAESVFLSEGALGAIVFQIALLPWTLF